MGIVWEAYTIFGGTPWKSQRLTLSQAKVSQQKARQSSIRIFPKNSGTPKWMVKIMENLTNPWMIWGEKTVFFGKHQGVDVPNTPPPTPHLSIWLSCPLDVDLSQTSKSTTWLPGILCLVLEFISSKVAHRKAYKRHYNSHVGKVCI